MPVITTERDRLLGILEYTEKLLCLGERIVLDIQSGSIAAFREDEVVGREGITLNPDNGDAWLEIRRIHETEAPKADSIFDGWIDGDLSNPDKPPRLLAQRIDQLSIEEISDLCNAGRLSADDVMEPLKPAPNGCKDALLQLTLLPEFQAAWEEYVSGPWMQWAELEGPRRRSIVLYRRLYQLHQRIVSLGEDNPIELVWGVGIASWQFDTTRILSPLVEQAIESNLEDDGSIVLRPRSAAPVVNLKPFHALDVEGSEAAQREAAAVLARATESHDLLFSPFEPASFEKVLQTCAARLSATARYYPDERKDRADRSIPNPSQHLIVTDTWIIFARQRTDDIRRGDLKRLMAKIEQLANDQEIPGPARAFVRPPSNARIHGEDIDLDNTDLEFPDGPAGGNPTSAAETGVDAHESDHKSVSTFFFPLPYNEEQIAIAEALKTHDGVVVQGPPGTGKTHTIANIISHYLATGKSVLVTAKTAEALTAVQEKLPEGIRSLAISVIHTDREGARQLETAMNVLANEAKQIDIRKTEDERKQKQHRIVEIQRRLASFASDLREVAKANLAKVPFQGRLITPMELAQEIARSKQQHEWFPDRNLKALEEEPRFSNSDIGRTRQLRSELGYDILYSEESLLNPSLLPPFREVLSAHEDLQTTTRIDDEISRGDIPLMVFAGAEDLDTARDLRSFLDDLDELHSTLLSSEWYKAVVAAIMRLFTRDDEALYHVLAMLNEWKPLAERGHEYIQHQVDVADTEHADDELTHAIEALCLGRNPYGFIPFGKTALKSKVESIRVGGQPPSTKKEWALIRDCRRWHAEVDAYLLRWRTMASSTGLPQHYRTWADGSPFILERADTTALIVRVAGQFPKRRAQVRRIAPYGFEVEKIFGEGETEALRRALLSNIKRAGHADVEALRMRLAALCKDAVLPFHVEMSRFATLLGNAEVGNHDLARVWQAILEEAYRLQQLRPKLLELEALVAKISASGAPLWAQMLRSTPVADERFSITPENWRDAWDWATADSFVRRIGDRNRVRMLAEEQAKLELDQKRLYSELVRLRTFLGLKIKMTESIEAAINKFTAAIARLGRGTGKAAPRYRRIIRSSTFEASHAIPCWIMPEWRVSEQLPPEIGLFDLVIIDEASQSDVTSLPAILRGKKILVVGDDKQVSPSTVGIEERQIIQLRTTFLVGNPYADQMDPGSSLYDLAAVVFPGRSIMLREHFRCVEPIIRFSSQFYPKALLPLRIPTATERLDPPLVDIFVNDGVRDGSGINEAEVDVIVREIRKLTDNRAFEERSIGVISLIGDKQARRIYERLLRELAPEHFARHRILCGNAATFQGQERDIVFLSMVECPKTSTTKTMRTFEQRFNVAMSRARDRLYLVRSVGTEHLNPNDLKYRVIEHFRNPMEGGNIALSNDVLDVCESGFERDLGGKLIELGYRIRAQVAVGGYRIDFVVEGEGDRRLAIECDGDSYHGPNRWADDVRRQKALERLGWIFWRVWGSQWYADRDGCVRDLIETLGRLHIKPLGSQLISYPWTEHRIVSFNETWEGQPAGKGASTKPNPAKADPVEPSFDEKSHSRSSAAVSAGAPRPDVVASRATARSPRKQPTRTVGGLFRTPNRDLFVEHRSQLPKSDQPVSAPIQAIATPDRARAGDSITIRYSDTNKVRKIRLSDRENRPDEGIIHISQPLGKALLGASIDDEVAFQVCDGARAAVVERIDREVVGEA